MPNKKRPSTFTNFSTFQFGEVLNNGGLTLLLTLSVYYFVTKTTEINYIASGIPTRFIEYPFYNLVKDLETPLTVVLPVLYFSTLLILMLNQRRKLKTFSNDELSYRDKVNLRKKIKFEYIDKDKAKREKNLYGMTAIVFLSMWVVSLKPSSSFSFVSQLILIAAIFLSIYFLFQHIYLCRKKISILTSLDKMFENGLKAFIMVAFYGNLLILSLAVYDNFKPYPMLVNLTNSHFNESSDYIEYQFEYLVSEKNDYGIWAKASVYLPDKEYENEPIYVFSEDVITRKMDGLDLRELEVNREFKLNSFSLDGYEKGFHTNLYFDNWDDVGRIFPRISVASQLTDQDHLRWLQYHREHSLSLPPDERPEFLMAETKEIETGEDGSLIVSYKNGEKWIIKKNNEFSPVDEKNKPFILKTEENNNEESKN